MQTRKPTRAKRRGRAAPLLSSQLALALPFTHGGAREGAGRPRSSKRYVAHRTRPGLSRHEPLLVTVRLVDGLPSLRTKRAFELIEQAFRAANALGDFRLVHYSVQGNHLHLIVEVWVDDPPGRRTRQQDAQVQRLAKRLLTSRMRGFGVRLARRLNRLLGRRGQVIAERYHARALRTPREVRHALVYVLGNRRKHLARAGRGFAGRWIDPFSSGVFFDGWAVPPWSMTTYASHDPPPIRSARTHLLRHGWRRHGAIDPADVPAAAA